MLHNNNMLGHAMWHVLCHSCSKTIDWCVVRVGGEDELVIVDRFWGVIKRHGFVMTYRGWSCGPKCPHLKVPNNSTRKSCRPLA